jgi:hypothetical protein
MVLPWKNYLETNEVSFQLTDDIKYIAYPDANPYILKIENDKKLPLDDQNWELEKQWISDNYGDIYGIYVPCSNDDLEEDDDKQCLFGKTPEGLYLDRIQRKEEWMNHSLTHPIIHIENWGILHTTDGGKTIWKTDWCDRLGEFFNVMRCDVFPDNPGWKQVDKAEILIELDNKLSTELKLGIINSSFPLPHNQYLSDDMQINPIGNILIQ